MRVLKFTIGYASKLDALMKNLTTLFHEEQITRFIASQPKDLAEYLCKFCDMQINNSRRSLYLSFENYSLAMVVASQLHRLTIPGLFQDYLIGLTFPGGRIPATISTGGRLFH